MKISRRTFIKTMALGTGTVAYLATGLTVHGAGPETYTLRIIHTNDHHARIEPVTGGTPPEPVHGGVSRRKTLIDAIRAEGGNQLLLDAGDVFQGDPSGSTNTSARPTSSSTTRWATRR